MPDVPAKDTPTKESPQVTKTAEPSGTNGVNPATAGPGPTKVQSNTPEHNAGQLNPSAPEDTNATPGSLAAKDGKGTIE